MRNSHIYSLLFSGVFFLTIATGIMAQQSFQTYYESIETTQENKLAESFSSYKVFSLDFSQINKYVKERYADNLIFLNLNINNVYEWQLTLEPNDMRSIGYKSVITTDNGEIEQKLQAVNTYKGFLNSNENDIVRLTIEDNNINGYIIENGEMHYIEQLKNFISDARPSQLIMYSPDDVIKKESFSCGVIEIENQKNNINNNLSKQSTSLCAGDSVIQVEIVLI